MPLLSTKRAEPDEKLEDFHLWTAAGRPVASPGLRRLVWLFAAAVAVAVAVGVSGYL